MLKHRLLPIWPLLLCGVTAMHAHDSDAAHTHPPATHVAAADGDKAPGILSDGERLIFVNHQQNQELAALRDWLLPMLMNGQVTVSQS